MRWIWRGAIAVVVVLVIWFILIPQFIGARSAFDSLKALSLPLVIAAVTLEAMSLIAYSALTWVTLNPETRPGFFTLLRIDMACLGVNNAVPGGGITATASKYRMLTLARTRPADAVAGTTVEVATSTLVLGGIFGVGVVLSLSSIRNNPDYLVAAVVVIAVALLALIGSALLQYFRDNTLRFVGFAVRRIPFISEQGARSLVGQIADQLEAFRGNRRRVVFAVGWAAINWLLDAAALWVLLLAFGYRDNVGTLLLVYSLASILGMLPITPGGLGIVEGVLVPALVGFGSPHGIALLGVVAWRLIEYWLPILVAGGAYASLRIGVLRHGPGSSAGSPRPAA
jgi:uncharacterized protein (TIRG00374 family)